MLRWRLLLGVLFVAGLAALFALDSAAPRAGTYLFPLAMLLAGLGTMEYVWLTSARQIAPYPAPLLIGNLLIVASAFIGTSGTNRIAAGWISYTALTLAFSLPIVTEMALYRMPGQVLVRMAVSTWGLLYVGVLLSFVVGLRLLDRGQTGVLALASLVIVVKSCDIGAYTVGRIAGKHPLAPTLSPKKTIEGLFGGLAFACLTSWLCFAWIGPMLPESLTAKAQPVGGWLLYGLLVGVAGVVGDLAESLLKRDMGRKDSSRWMPGFGGILDILDSVLFAAPIAWLAWVIGGATP